MSSAGVILIVEDDDAIRDTMIEVLSDAGYAVRAVANGAEALDVLKTLRPQLILLDWGMPRMTGEQFLAVTKADPSLGSIPVVVLTASHRREVSALGERFVQKPISLDALLELAREYCEQQTA